jgi:Mitoguardin
MYILCRGTVHISTVSWKNLVSILGCVSSAHIYACLLFFQFQKGFIAHFYAVSEAVSPTLAWGFLGPDGPLKDMCNFFKVLTRAVCHLSQAYEFLFYSLFCWYIQKKNCS